MQENPMAYQDMTRENDFWLRLFRDHAEFMQDTLVPQQATLIAQAQQFFGTFDALLGMNDRNALAPEDAMQATCQFRIYQQGVANLLLMGQPVINLPPGAIQEMLDEADEYLKVLGGIQPMNEAQFLMEEHMLWLSNNAAHAALAAAQLDPSEVAFFNRFEHYHTTYRELQLKNGGLMQLLKENPIVVPPLSYLTRQSINITQEFLVLLGQYKDLRTTGEVMSISPPLLIDHFLREASYYLEKIGRIC